MTPRSVPPRKRSRPRSRSHLRRTPAAQRSAGLARRLLAAGAALWTVLATAACKSGPAAGPPATDPNCSLTPGGYGPSGSVQVRAETVVTGLEVPWAIAFLPNGDMLVTERLGRLRIVHDGKLLPATATLPVSQEAESGLLGLALAPDFASTRRFFVYFTGKDEGGKYNRVERWTLAADASSAARDKVIVERIPAAVYHDGGRIRIGPDGMLYVGTGDGRQPFSSQLPGSLGGKLLRLTPDGGVPADNPIAGSPVFMLGIRNTQGFDWIDEKTLVVTDHGPSGELSRTGHDEVNVAGPGANLGWPTFYSCEAGEKVVTPSLTWESAVPPGGASFYTGTAIPEWSGSLLVGTLRSKHLHRVVFDKASPRKVVQHEVYFAGDPPAGFGRLRDVVMGPDGHLYVTTSNCDGRGDCPPDKDRILRILR